jgi:small subunit ribosomal protein S16
MSVRVRLTRVGSKKNPIWRVVVADQRSPRDGRSIETIGHYNPQTQPSTITIDRERLDHWLERGAVPSNTVRKLMRAENTSPAVVEEATASEAEAGAAAPSDVAAATEPEASAVEPEAEAPAAEPEPPAAEPEAAADAPAPEGDAPESA